MGRFRLVAFLEGITLIGLLLVTMPLKYVLDFHLPNLVLGFFHGALFVIYCFMLLRLMIEYKWKFGFAVMAFIASFIPGGTFYMDRKHFKGLEESQNA